MKSKGVTKKVDQDDVARYLHNLGEILYFEERQEIADLVILDPEWLTKMIGLVVRSKEAQESGGILRKADLDQLWRAYRLDPEVRGHLVNLMDSFDLTYRTGHSQDVGIVVEALPYATPRELKSMELPEDRPYTEMLFRFPLPQRHLPPGVPTWAIARLHRYLEGKDDRKGERESANKPRRDAAAFFHQATGSRALIRSSDTAREILLRVSGDYPPYFFGVVLDALQETFKRYPGAAPEYRLPCRCTEGCDFSYRYDVVMKRRREKKTSVTCGRSGDDVMIESLLSGALTPETQVGSAAVLAEVRRSHTVLFESLRGLYDKNFPLIFTLSPSKGFAQLETWIESNTKEHEIQLTLYCEHDSGWHTTSSSVYRFTPDQEWVGKLKGQWNRLASATKIVGKLVSHFGKAPGGDALGLATEMLPEVPRSAADVLSREIGGQDKPGFVDIAVRDLLWSLIANLDAKRSDTEHKNGGLIRCIIEDGRVLWLCHEHAKPYLSR